MREQKEKVITVFFCGSEVARKEKRYPRTLGFLCKQSFSIGFYILYLHFAILTTAVSTVISKYWAWIFVLSLTAFCAF